MAEMTREERPFYVIERIDGRMEKLSSGPLYIGGDSNLRFIGYTQNIHHSKQFGTRPEAEDFHRAGLLGNDAFVVVEHMMIAAAIPDLPEIEGMRERVAKLEAELKEANRDRKECSHELGNACMALKETEDELAAAESSAASARRAGMEEMRDTIQRRVRKIIDDSPSAPNNYELGGLRTAKDICEAIDLIPLPATSPQEEGWNFDMEAAPRGPKLFLAFRNSSGRWWTAMGSYAEQFTLPVDDDGEEGPDDGMYAPAGWYEHRTDDGEMARLNPDAWQPCPPPPAQPTTGEG